MGSGKIKNGFCFIILLILIRRNFEFPFFIKFLFGLQNLQLPLKLQWFNLQNQSRAFLQWQRRMQQIQPNKFI